MNKFIIIVLLGDIFMRQKRYSVNGEYFEYIDNKDEITKWEDYEETYKDDE